MTNAAAERGWIPDQSFGARLILVRQHMGWGNVQEAAIACRLPVSSWRNWERDGRLPREYAAVCVRVAEATGCDLAWLMGADQARELGARAIPTRRGRRTESRCTPPWGDPTVAIASGWPSPAEATRTVAGLRRAS